MDARLTTKTGLTTLPRPLTRKQAMRHGLKNMPLDLKRAGFECHVSETDQEMHGWHGYRINYGK